jgi:hypothetical protein
LIASLHLMDYDIKQHFEEVEINVLVQLSVTVHMAYGVQSIIQKDQNA